MENIEKKYSIIENHQNDGSSAICLDIRNSTKLINQYTDLTQLKFHANFLIDIKELIFQDGIKGELSVNDTGDGMIFLFWNKTHAWTALLIGVAIYELLTKHLAKKYDNFLKANNINEQFGFGIGIHSDSSLIYRNKKTQQDFMFGVVLNTTVRLESFTKTFKDINLLMTGHFIDVLKDQLNDFNKLPGRKIKLIFSELEKDIKSVCSEKVEINDAKKIGHTLWTINDTHNLLPI